MNEWSPYRIKIPSAAISSPNDGVLLETIYHVVHVPTARRILEDGRLRARLIYDESRLNRSRTCVTWLSANTWWMGSIYGNVQFSFSWKGQIKDRNCYWVEVMTNYSPHAYRILFTHRDLSSSKHVQPYDPTSSKGPLRERNGTWYWNRDYTSEFMIESDVDLALCTDFDFVPHHPDKCRLDGSSCQDRSSTPYRIGGKVIAHLLAHKLHTIDRVLKRSSAKRPLHTAVDVGADGILRSLGIKNERFGGAIRNSSSAKAVMRGALALYGSGRAREARELVALLKSPAIFETALCELVNEHFGITSWTIPD